MQRQGFDKLAKNLSEEERQDFLSKLKPEDKNNLESQSFSPSSNKRGDKKSLENELTKLATNHFKQSGFLDKFIIILTSFFSGKNKEEVIIEKEFSKLKKDIQNKYYNILDFDNKLLMHNFANEVIILNEAVSKIREMIENLFFDTEFYNEFIYDLFEGQISESFSKALKNLKPEEIKSTEFIDKTAYLREKDRKLKDFFDTIDKARFDVVINQIEKLEIALKLFRFDYQKILQAFGIVNFDTITTNKSTASFFTIEKNLERFYSLLIDFNFSNTNIQILTDFMKFTKSKEETYSNNILDKNFTDQDLKKIQNTINIFKVFFEKVPMDKIFKYCKGDILYNIPSKNSSSNAIEIYKSMKRKKVDNEWETYYLSSKKVDLKKLMVELFGDANFFTLTFYNENLYENILKANNVKLTTIYLMNFLIFFIKKFYKHNIEIFVSKILIDGNFTDDISKLHLTGAYHTINNAIEKFGSFDIRFNQENDYGKKLKLYLDRTSGIVEADLKKSFQNYCIDINDTALSLSNEILNSINALFNFFSKLSPSTERSERPLVNIDSLKNITFQGFQNQLEKYNDIFSKFFKIYKQIETIY